MPNKNIIPKIFLLLAATATSLEIYSELAHIKPLMFYTKLFLSPCLTAYYISSAHKKWNRVHLLMAGALIFSWFGGISLMLAPETPADTEIMGISKNKYWFLGGVGSFFVTQMLFISSYRKAVLPIQNRIKKAAFLPFVLYWIILLSFVLPPLYNNEEKNEAVVPVIIYACTVISMAAVALTRYGRTSSKSFWLTFIGACIFVISDSLIAINYLALNEPTPFAGSQIMITYIAAEFLIAQGILEHYKKAEA